MHRIRRHIPRYIHHMSCGTTTCKINCAQGIVKELYDRFTLSFIRITTSHFLIFDLISLHSALLRDIHSLGDSDRHVLSNSWWLQSIVRSQEDRVDVLQGSAFGLWSEKIEHDDRKRVGANVYLGQKSAVVSSACGSFSRRTK
jgi:hypothetical protein